MSGCMKLVLKNSTPITHISPRFPYTFRPPSSHLNEQKIEKGWHERKINGWMKEKKD